MVTRSVVQSAMHTAAMALAHLPCEEWAGWVTYLCETLEQTPQDQECNCEAEDVMREIINLLQDRLARGGW
jgi:hypothetical protein